MVEIRYRCPHCAEKLCVAESAAGTQMLCPQCRGTGRVPGPAPPGALLSVDIRFRCPGCEKKMAVDVCHAGEVTTCPSCHASLSIPGLPDDPGAVAPSTVLTPGEVDFLMAQ